MAVHQRCPQASVWLCRRWGGSALEHQIQALGFDPEDVPALFSAPDLGVTRWGTIHADFTTMATNLEGVYAAGDIVRGASLVVWAIADGRLAAQSIHNYLKTKALAPAERVVA